MLAPLSKAVSRHSAARMPRPTAIGTAMAAVTPARNMVLAKRGAICASTVAEGSTRPVKLAKLACAKLTPRSPRAASQSHCT